MCISNNLLCLWKHNLNRLTAKTYSWMERCGVRRQWVSLGMKWMVMVRFHQSAGGMQRKPAGWRTTVVVAPLGSGDKEGRPLHGGEAFHRTQTPLGGHHECVKASWLYCVHYWGLWHLFIWHSINIQLLKGRGRDSRHWRVSGVRPPFPTLGLGWELEGHPSAVPPKRILLLRMLFFSLERPLTSSSAFNLLQTAILA